jgi:hypothetical protein
MNPLIYKGNYGEIFGTVLKNNNDFFKVFHLSNPNV